MRVFKKFTDYQDVKYQISGHDLNVNTVTGLEIYGGDTKSVYIQKKKVIISEQDLITIATARCEEFITRVLNRSEDGNYYHKDDYYKAERKTFTTFNPDQEFPALETEMNELLKAEGFTLVELPSRFK